MSGSPELVGLSGPDLAAVTKVAERLLNAAAPDGVLEATRAVGVLVGVDGFALEVLGQGLTADGMPSSLTNDAYPAWVRWLEQHFAVRPDVRMRALGVWDRPSLWAGEYQAYLRTPYYHEFVRLSGVTQLLGLAVPNPGDLRTPAGPPDSSINVGPQLAANAHFFRASRAQPFDDRARTILRLVRPVLASAVQAGLRAAGSYAAFVATVDARADRVLLLDMHGRIRHRNPAASALLESLASDDREALEQAAGRLARVVVAGSADLLRPGAWRSKAGGRVFELECTVISALVPSVPVLMVVRGEQAPCLTDEQLAARFGLSGREVEVARLLAERRSNQEIADALGVSFHTARHHVSRVLSKLGVRSRRDVAATCR